MTDTTAGEGVRMFGPEVENVQSRYIIVHQLRASADIQSEEVTRRMGRKATTDRATLMRKAADLIEALAAQPSAGAQPALTVWYGKMPESNGRENWTATIRRVNATDKWDSGFCFARSEYPGRVLYEADRMRWLIGELSERPDILAYDADTHSDYVEPLYATPAQPDTGDVAALREATGGEAVIRGGKIVISIDVDALPMIVSGSCATYRLDGLWKVTDAEAFAKDVCISLNAESENGTTRVHKMFDGAFDHAIDQGAEGIDAITEPEFEVEASRLRLAALSKPNAPGAPADGGA